MAKVKIIVTPKPKRKLDRELKKQLKELEKFEAQRVTSEKPKRLIPIEEYPKQAIKLSDNTITIPHIKELKSKKKRQKAVELYQRSHNPAIKKSEVPRIKSGGRKSKKKSKKLKSITPPASIEQTATPPSIEQTATPPSIEQTATPLIEDYVPTADIFEIIEDAIYSKIPNETMVWKKGHKGGIPVDLTSLKQQAIFLIRDYAVSNDTDVIDYFQRNENAIMECVDSFTYASQSEGFNTLVERFLNLINMGNALSSEAMYYNEVSEILDIY